MKPDFKNAYERHQKDANSLFDNKRYANADHLYGLAAECALKAIMMGLDPCIANNKGDLNDPKDKKHINFLWDHFKLFIQGRSASSYLAYVSMKNPFNKWSIEARYAHQKFFTKIEVESHKTAVNNTIAYLVADARMKGHL